MIWVALAAVFVALAVLAGWVVVLRRRLLVVTVIGVSMEPTYSSGDRLLVRRSRLKGIRTGQIVVVQVSGAATGDTTAGRLVKRAVAVPGDPVPPQIPISDQVVPEDRLLVLGDNPAHSDDSRRLGYIPADALIGVVLRPIGQR
jgi:signal peptidase I